MRKSLFVFIGFAAALFVSWGSAEDAPKTTPARHKVKMEKVQGSACPGTEDGSGLIRGVFRLRWGQDDAGVRDDAPLGGTLNRVEVYGFHILLELHGHV